MIAKLTSWTLMALGLCLLTLAVLLFVRWLRHVQLSRLTQRLDHVQDELSEDVAGGSPRSRQAASLIIRARYVIQKARKSRDHKLPTELIDVFDEDLVKFRNNEDIHAEKRGAILKAYVSEIDGTLQSYSVNVPKDYLGDHAVGLLVHLHGHGWFRSFQEHPAPEYRGAIVLAPHGRGATDYLAIGERDVLRAIEEVRRDYRIDDDRIYLSGASMGGTGCWNLAVHHPDLFAGVAPRSGNADTHAWEGRWKWNTGELPHRARLRRALRELDNPLTYAENLHGMPIVCLHNAGDEVVPVEHARAMVDAVRAAGADCRYLEFLTGGHVGFEKTTVEEQLAWMASHRRQPDRHIRFVAGRLRHGTVGWVSIEGLEVPLKLARVDSEVADDGSIHMTCQNISAVRLSPPNLGEQATVIINGRKLARVPVDPDGSLRLHLQDGRWLPGGFEETVLRKRPGLEGPVDEVFLSPFLLVHGTQDVDEHAARALLDEVDRFAREWTRRFGGSPRRCPDTDVTEADVANYNLVLFGRPDQNLVLKRFADRLPIHIEPDVIDAFGARYDGADVGTIFCYPNPEVRGRMLVVYAALGDAGYHQIHTRFGKWFNWGVFDCRKWFDYALFDARTRDPETFLNVGFFDSQWHYDAEFAFPGLDELRKETPPQTFPAYVEPPEDAPVVYLSDLKPVGMDQMRGAVGFDRSFRGEELVIGGRIYRRGLGVRVPSSIRYKLAGEFKTLKTVVGLSRERAHPDSAVRDKHEAVAFVVVGDGKTLWESELIDSENPLQEVEVSVRGVHLLELRVIPKSRWLWLHGSTAWGDARLIRQ